MKTSSKYVLSTLLTAAVLTVCSTASARGGFGGGWGHSHNSTRLIADLVPDATSPNKIGQGEFRFTTGTGAGNASLSTNSTSTTAGTATGTTPTVTTTGTGATVAAAGTPTSFSSLTGGITLPIAGSTDSNAAAGASATFTVAQATCTLNIANIRFNYAAGTPATTTSATTTTASTTTETADYELSGRTSPTGAPNFDFGSCVDASGNPVIPQISSGSPISVTVSVAGAPVAILSGVFQ